MELHLDDAHRRDRMERGATRGKAVSPSLIPESRAASITYVIKTRELDCEPIETLGMLEDLGPLWSPFSSLERDSWEIPRTQEGNQLS